MAGILNGPQETGIGIVQPMLWESPDDERSADETPGVDVWRSEPGWISTVNKF